MKRLSSVKINTTFFKKYFDKDARNETLLFNNIRHDFQVTKVFKKLTFYAVNLFCNRQYKEMLHIAKIKIDKELDLRKFILRQRLLTTAILGLLNGR